MASGYITSDGKDLDQRYLGIDAKAKSAETADIATSAQTVTSLVGVTPVISVPQQPVMINTIGGGGTKKSWEAPSNGLLVGTVQCYGANPKAYIKLRGEYVLQTDELYPLHVYWALKKGDIIETTAWRSGTSYQYGISANFFPWDFLEASEEE